MYVTPSHESRRPRTDFINKIARSTPGHGWNLEKCPKKIKKKIKEKRTQNFSGCIMEGEHSEEG
jgi:hypothetical protein